MTHPTPFQMSIEPAGEAAFKDGFHLGSDEALARSLVEERFHGRNRVGMATNTVALLDGRGRVVDVYDGGGWSHA